MARILYWNIEQFGFNKIKFMSNKRNLAGAFKPDYEAQDRRNLILRHVRDFNPDIFVVIEVSTGSNAVGSLLTKTGGWDGCTLLMQELAGLPGAPQWNLVPPLVVGIGGRAEAVGIFYKRTSNAGNNLYFTGPNQWSNLGGGQSFVPNVIGAPARAAYQAPFSVFCFPNGSRGIHANALYNANIQENECAAKVAFNNQHGAAINYNDLRPPYMATFSELTGAGAVVQHITIFAVHSPPQVWLAPQFLTELADVNDIRTPPAANETKLIMGDFNVNLLDNTNNVKNSYNALTLLGYVKQLNPAGGPPHPLDGYQGYFATHVKDAENSVFWSSNVQTLYYPGYGYIGSSFVNNFYSIDNILVRGGAPQNFTIANSITGTPLNVVPNPVPGTPPLGHVPFNTDFQNPPVGWPQNPAPNFALGMNQIYRSWRNFEHIRSTSDHLALYVEL